VPATGGVLLQHKTCGGQRLLLCGGQCRAGQQAAGCGHALQVAQAVGVPGAGAAFR